MSILEKLRLMGKILILEDDTDLKDIILNVLRGQGHEAIIAHDTLDAFKIINNNSINAAIVDCTPPNSSRHELLIEIRKSNQFVPVIFTSAGFTDFETDQNSCLLMKPYDLDLIMEFFNNTNGLI